VKILIDQHLPFLLAHGGANTQVEQTLRALQQEGVEAEYLRWWDESQRADLIHFFGMPPISYLNQARLKRLPVIVNTLFTDTCNRPLSKLKWQGRMVRAVLAVPFGNGLKQRIGWQAYEKCSHNVVGLAAERTVLEVVYRVLPDRISVVPYGLNDAFFKAGSGPRTEKHLICTGTITARKCSVELATLARAAQVPILFVGKPYSESEPYWLKFKSLIDDQWVKYQSHVDSEAKMISLLQSARGFVLMSWYENWCLSAHEAAACGLPVLVQDQNWSRERFHDQARYFSSIGVSDDNVRILKKFYDDAPQLAAPTERQYSWREVARQLIAVYQKTIAANA
jgi:glycosyltransferase involved in cell wall biosynthesis